MIADKSKTADPMLVSRALLHLIDMTFPGTIVQRQDGVYEWRTSDGEVTELMEDAESV